VGGSGQALLVTDLLPVQAALRVINAEVAGLLR